jgi:hypothetical protein
MLDFSEGACHHEFILLQEVQNKNEKLTKNCSIIIMFWVISSFPHSPKANRTNPLILVNLLVITPNILRLHKPSYASQKMRDWSGLILGREGMGNDPYFFNFFFVYYYYYFLDVSSFVYPFLVNSYDEWHPHHQHHHYQHPSSYCSYI